MKETLVHRFLPNIAQPNTIRAIAQHKQLKQFPNKMFNHKNITQYLRACFSMFVSAEKIFNFNCDREKTDIIFIILQIELLMHSYEAMNSNRRDREWNFIFRKYFTKSLGRINTLGVEHLRVAKESSSDQ
jgi:hypothetical protein